MKDRGQLGPASAREETLIRRESTGEDRSNHPFISFLRVLRRRFEEKTNPWERLDRGYSDRDGSNNEDDDQDGKDEEFLSIDFSSIDDVIKFYESDVDDEGDDSEREVSPSCIPDEYDCCEETSKANNEDAIVSSWIDNYHFLLAEQEIRKQTRKRVRFKTTATEGDLDGPSPGAIVVVTGDDDDYEDDDSVASSCCSSSTNSTWRSLDTIEEQEFEEFANRWRRDRGIHGKNTEKSFLGRLLREILVGPLDEDFEAEEEDELFPGRIGECAQKSEGRGEHPETNTESAGIKDPREIFYSESPLFPEDLLFSIERQ